MKIAVVVESPHNPAPWIRRLIEKISEAAELELCAIIKPSDERKRSEGRLLYQAWMWVEKQLAARQDSPRGSAYESARTSLPLLRTDQAEQINSLNLETIIDLTGREDISFVAASATHGIWFLDFLRAEPGAAALRAIMGTESVTQINLLRQVTKDSKPLGIATASLNTKFIAARNSLFMCEKAVTLIIRELKRTQQLGTPRISPGLVLEKQESLSLLDLRKYFIGLFSEIFVRILEAVWARLHLRPGMFFLKMGENDFLSFDPSLFIPCLPKGNIYFADPFLWDYEERTYCFFETYDYASGKGHISVGQLAEGKLLEVRTVLITDYHLSFPFLFEDNGTLYMMPETCSARRLEIWRCTAFPDKWERHATALEGVVAADSTLARIEETWWLFTNISDDPFEEMNSELHLFQLDGPHLKSLIPHTVNPVVFDARTARNAGRILEKDGHYYRPSQNNSHGVYGYGLNLMRIDRLTLNEYMETPVRTIEPTFEDGIIGCHHLDYRSGRIVIDVRKRLGGLRSAF